MAQEKFVTAGTFTWTCPFGVNSVRAEGWGAGGGGGAVPAVGGQGGGGGGAYALTVEIAVNAGTAYTVVVGLHGTVGVDGGFSSFNTTSMKATGGQGAAGIVGGAGGGTGSCIGDLKLAGGNGGTSNSIAGAGGGSSAGDAAAGVNGGASAGATPGAGGIAPDEGGNGGDGNTNDQPAFSGGFPGAGGGGAGENGLTSGEGADGQVILTWEEPAPSGTVSSAPPQPKYTYLEVTPAPGNEGGGAGASRTSAKATKQYNIFLAANDQAPVANLLGIWQDILGDVSLAVTNGVLRRKLPRNHPTWPWWYAANVPTLRGVGSYARLPFNRPFTSPDMPLNSIDEWSFYNGTPVNYEVTIEFEPRPYAVAPDNAINLITDSWYNEAGTKLPYLACSEWLRFTDWNTVPKFEFATAQIGAGMVFRDTEVETLTHKTADNKMFAGFPRLFLPDQFVKFRWFQVPYRYITDANSYLDKYRGYINQKDWYNWKEGSLLYLGYEATRYSPPIPRIAQLPLVDGDFLDVFSTEKVCDIELTFLHTRRTTKTAKKPKPDPNPNWLTTGHNLEGWWGDLKFHYVTARLGDPTPDDQQRPTFLSVPFEILFMDPEVPNPNI